MGFPIELEEPDRVAVGAERDYVGAMTASIPRSTNSSPLDVIDGS